MLDVHSVAEARCLQYASVQAATAVLKARQATLHAELDGEQNVGVSKTLLATVLCQGTWNSCAN